MLTCSYVPSHDFGLEPAKKNSKANITNQDREASIRKRLQAATNQ